jgi:hypothetical protein
MGNHELEAHIFRSVLLDRFAEIERWLLVYLTDNHKPFNAKAPLGQKMAALHQLMNDGVGVSKTSKKLGDLLSKLASYSATSLREK